MKLRDSVKHQKINATFTISKANGAGHPETNMGSQEEIPSQNPAKTFYLYRAGGKRKPLSNEKFSLHFQLGQEVIRNLSFFFLFGWLVFVCLCIYM